VLVSVRMERQAAHAVCLHRSGDGVVSSAGAVLLELKEVNGVSMAVCVATAMGDVVVHEVRAPSAAFSTPPPAFSSERVDVRGTLRLCWVWFSCARACVCVCVCARVDSVLHHVAVSWVSFSGSLLWLLFRLLCCLERPQSPSAGRSHWRWRSSRWRSLVC
jgi:hypothetical protein